jgi:hypothetical protein
MTSGRSNIVDIACVIIHETELAWLIDAGTGDHVWIPKSIGEYDPDGTIEYDPTDGTIAMPEWIEAQTEKGLI